MMTFTFYFLHTFIFSIFFFQWTWLQDYLYNLKKFLILKAQVMDNVWNYEPKAIMSIIILVLKSQITFNEITIFA